MRVTKIAILIECFVADFIVTSVAAQVTEPRGTNSLIENRNLIDANFRPQIFREAPFVAYVICSTDRWTLLGHNSTYALIHSGEIVDANANFVLLSGCRNYSFWGAGSGQHSIGIEAAAGIAKDWRSTAVQGRAR